MIEALQPILDLLGGNARSQLATFITWLLAFRFALVFLHGRIQRWVADKMNAVAASANSDDDAFLLELFRSRPWKTAVGLGLLVGFPLPSIADLERAIRLQQEAAATAKPITINQNPS